MLRVILALALLLAVGSLGYWFGAQPKIPSPGTTRARTAPQPRMETLPDIQHRATAPNSANLPQQDSMPPAPGADEAATVPLLHRALAAPVANLKRDDVHDTFYQSRGGGERRHEASDIMAPRGTPVIAVDNGTIEKLFNSKAGGITVYQFDSSRQYCFYYAHLDRYAEGLAEGQFVRKGTVIGYVGSTGNADINAPHLHFAIFELGAEKRWWEGNKPLNPYPLLMALSRQ